MSGPLAIISAKSFRTNGVQKSEDGKTKTTALERKRGHGELQASKPQFANKEGFKAN